MAKDDDFDVDLDDENAPGTEPDEDDEQDEKPKPDEGRDRLRNAVKATRKERDEAKRQLAELRAELAEIKRGGKPADDGKADAERDRDADERAFARYRPVLVKAAAEAALVRAGAKPDRVARLVRLLDADEVNVDEKGTVDVDDLTAEVDRLKEDMPELFRADDDEDGGRKRPVAARGGRRDGAARGGDGRKAPTSTSRLAAQLTGSRTR